MKNTAKYILTIIACLSITIGCEKAPIQVNHEYFVVAPQWASTPVYDVNGTIVGYDIDIFYLDKDGNPVPIGESLFLPVGYSILIDDVEDYVNGNLIGYRFRFWQDRSEPYGTIDAGDRLLHERVITNGTSEYLDISYEYDDGGFWITYTVTNSYGEVVREGTHYMKNGVNGITYIPRTLDELDAQNNKMGFTFEVWADIDGVVGITDGDTRVIKETILLYLDFSYTIVVGDAATTVTFLFNVNGDVRTFSITVPHGHDGKPAPINVFTFEQVQLYVDGTLRNGTKLTVWLDDDRSGTYTPGDVELGSTIILDGGANGQEGITYVTYAITYDFNVGDSHDDMMRGWQFNHVSTSKDGMNGLYDGANEGWAITPLYPDSSFIIGFNYYPGSRWDHDVTFNGYADGTIVPLYTHHGQGNPFFDRLDRSTYEGPKQFLMDLGAAEGHGFHQAKVIIGKVAGEDYSGYDRDHWQYVDDIGIIFAVRVPRKDEAYGHTHSLKL